MQFYESYCRFLPTRVVDPKESDVIESRNGALFLWDVVQPTLRKLWIEPTSTMKRDALVILAGKYMVECGSAPDDRAIYPTGEPAPDAFFRVLMFALDNVHLLKYCANPECPEPYFVAERGSQVYCSPSCAKPSQRAAKLKWWAEHGTKRRKELRKKGRKHAKAKKA